MQAVFWIQYFPAKCINELYFAFEIRIRSRDIFTVVLVKLFKLTITVMQEKVNKIYK